MFTNQSGDRPEVPNFAILITGGLLFSEFTLPLAYHAQQQGIHVFGIGIGLSVKDEGHLNELVSEPHQLNAYNHHDIARLNDIVDKIVATLCEGRQTLINIKT